MPFTLDPHIATIEGWLAAQPQLTALAIVGRLSGKYPEEFATRQHSIVQRLLRALRRKVAEQLVAQEPLGDATTAAPLLRFVEASDDGPLFAKGSYKRVVDFVRTVVTDKRVRPNHAWRHRLKTIARDLGLDHRVIDCIQGHAARTARQGQMRAELQNHVAVLLRTILINNDGSISPRKLRRF
jgi:hypothetical protein